MMKGVRSVGYVRSAVIDQSMGQADPLHSQEAAIARAVGPEGTLGERARLLAVLSDPGRPATDKDRPGLRILLRMIRAGQVDAVVVTRIDRITRSFEHLKELWKEFERRRVRLVSLEEGIDTGTAPGMAKLDAIGHL